MHIVILGGGIAGLTAAALLSQNPCLQITLIEAKKPNFTWDKNKYDLRCSAITRASQQVFKHLDIWGEILAVRTGVYRQMLVWGQGSMDPLQFNADAINQSDLGHIVENRVMQRALWNKIAARSNVLVKFGLAQKVEQLHDAVRIYIDNECLECKLIIGADGAESWLRKAANISVHGYDYQQHALVATIHSQIPHANIARQRFTLDGPLAFLPLDKPDLSSIVWSCPTVKIRRLLDLGSTDFCAQLSREFCGELGGLELYGECASFPLRVQHVQTYIAPRIALIGDAAHVVHPLAGQGLNLGLMDAATLAEVVLQALTKKCDIGAFNILRKYERWRKEHILTMLTITDGFNRGYKINTDLMRMVNNVNVAKNATMRFAMGLIADLPACAKSPAFIGVE